MSLTLSWSHLAQKMRRHSLAGTRLPCLTVCEMLQSEHGVWGLVCHHFNSETPLPRGLQQGGTTGTGCLCLPGGCIEFLSLSSASRRASSANYEQCHPFLLLYVYFSSLSWPGWPLFCRGMRGLRLTLRPRLSFSSD